MGSRRSTVTVDVDVDVDINDFDTDDLIDELKYRGYIVLDERDEKDYQSHLELGMWKLRQSYITDTPENFRKFLESTFQDMDMPV